jgi:hypothetical protein
MLNRIRHTNADQPYLPLPSSPKSSSPSSPRPQPARARHASSTIPAASGASRPRPCRQSTSARMAATSAETAIAYYGAGAAGSATIRCNHTHRVALFRRRDDRPFLFKIHSPFDSSVFIRGHQLARRAPAHTRPAAQRGGAPRSPSSPTPSSPRRCKTGCRPPALVSKSSAPPSAWP